MENIRLSGSALEATGNALPNTITGNASSNKLSGLAGNDTINQAREFFQYTNFDGAILTKIDADAKGGAAISISHITAKPVVYVGVGQG